MCDTLGRIGTKRSCFAKNSDRSPNEVQLLEYHPEKTGLRGMVSCTYISIPQAERTYAVLLSRPQWMWGAEMGVNQWGLTIGNEAVFTKGAYGKTGLTGMDLVRLALERCKTAREATELIPALLEAHGQGGNCGFDHSFYYDNSFLIMDRRELYVLETAGREWVCRRSSQANISNRLSVGPEGNAYSGGKALNFAKEYTEPVFTTFSGSGRRWQQLRGHLHLADHAGGCMEALRCHDRGARPFREGSVSSVCMHYGGMVGDHTTASMVVCLEEDRILVWATGTSLPCVSLFKPWVFGTEPVLPVTAPEEPEGAQYWLRGEQYRRALLGREPGREFYARRNALEKEWIAQAERLSREEFPAFSRRCLQEEAALFKAFPPEAFPEKSTSPCFRRRWAGKNKVLFSQE